MTKSGLIRVDSLESPDAWRNHVEAQLMEAKSIRLLSEETSIELSDLWVFGSIESLPRLLSSLPTTDYRRVLGLTPPKGWSLKPDLLTESSNILELLCHDTGAVVFESASSKPGDKILQEFENFSINSTVVCIGPIPAIAHEIERALRFVSVWRILGVIYRTRESINEERPSHFICDAYDCASIIIGRIN